MQGKQDYRKTRQYYRIRYPHSYRPKVRIEGEKYDHDVVELSERGLRFLCKDASTLSRGSELRVKITFHDGESFELEGQILRVEKKDVIVRFSDSLPLNRIMGEQIYLRSRFIRHL